MNLRPSLPPTLILLAALVAYPAVLPAADDGDRPCTGAPGTQGPGCPGEVPASPVPDRSAADAGTPADAAGPADPGPIDRTPQIPTPVVADEPPEPELPLTPAELPPVEPTGIADTGRQDLGGEPPPAAGRTPTTTGAPTGEARLYQDLPWDYCGPRPGATGPGGSAPPPPSGTPVDLEADRADYARDRDYVTLRGDVEVNQQGQRLESDRASYDHRSGRIDAFGNVFLEYPGVRVAADTANYNLETKTGALTNPRYRMYGNANLRGTADRARILSQDLSWYKGITYTTCPPGNWDWSIKASELELDQESGMGKAYHARIRLAGVPVLYSPYLRFPIDDRRRSGLLVPTFGTSDKTGTDITIPYYWNIAPNLDATFFPRYMSARGLMLGAQLRYLSPIQRLEINGDYLPNDQKAPENRSRDAVRIEQTGNIENRWLSAIDYSAVSDDQYLVDFGNRLDVTSVRNLTQRGDLRYKGTGWGALLRLQQFQTVDPSIPRKARPYAQLPHIELNLEPARWKDLVTYQLDTQYDYFDNSARTHGSRVVAVPSLRLPIRRSYGYLDPRVHLYYKSYDLVDQRPDASERPSYAIPSLDIDGKLIFERDTRWFGQGVLQTLEPRLYYVLTPYQDQWDTPLFDTTELGFSFASLFRPNRFTGYDRISDENRLTVGLTSRTISTDEGDELLRASVGQIQYFDDRRVSLRDNREPDDPSRSAVAGELAARLSRNWSARASLQWNPNEDEEQWEKRILELRYSADDRKLVNLAYRFNVGSGAIQGYEDTDLSFRMPVGRRVQLVGRWLYSLLQEDTVEAFAGIEFGRCCWRLRVLGRHLKTSAESDGNTSIMLQLELAGLGALGNQIDKLLERGIYGYQSY